jgi:hypothetical protein
LSQSLDFTPGVVEHVSRNETVEENDLSGIQHNPYHL